MILCHALMIFCPVDDCLPANRFVASPIRSRPESAHQFFTLPACARVGPSRRSRANSGPANVRLPTWFSTFHNDCGRRARASHCMDDICTRTGDRRPSPHIEWSTLATPKRCAFDRFRQEATRRTTEGMFSGEAAAGSWRKWKRDAPAGGFHSARFKPT